MVHVNPQGKAIEIALLLVPRFPLLSLAICTETLRVANREMGTYLFSRRIVTVDGENAASSSGIEISPDLALAEIDSVDVAIVLSSYSPEEAAAPPLLAWLRRQDRMGALLACIDTGAYLLARAGVLGSRHVAVHHEALPAYQELFEDAVLLDEPAALDDRLASSAGGMATMDMMARILSQFHDQALADQVMNVLKYRMPDSSLGDRTVPRNGALERVDRRLARLVDLMLGNIDNPMSIGALCRACHVDASTARRLFLRHFGESTGRYYMRPRLDRAASLLSNSHMQIGRIASLSGFNDAAAFSRAFKRQFGVSPSKSRQLPSGHEENSSVVSPG